MANAPELSAQERADKAFTLTDYAMHYAMLDALRDPRTIRNGIRVGRHQERAKSP